MVFKWFPLTALLLFFSVAGCSHADRMGPTVHDETIYYQLPYDLVYLRAMEAVQAIAGWELESTHKEKGLIIVRNINYSSFDEADRRSATIEVVRVSRNETSVQLAKYSQRVIGGDDLLKQVSKFINREL